MSSDRMRAVLKAGRDGGSIAPLVPIVMFALLLLGGLVVDGSRVLNARGNAQAYAEEAARAGASATDPTSASLALIDDEATKRIDQYCAAVMGTTHADVQVMTCGPAGTEFTSATVCGGTTAPIVVNTEVTVRTDTTLLGLIGVAHFTATGHASARPYEGVNAADRC